MWRSGLGELRGWNTLRKMFRDLENSFRVENTLTRLTGALNGTPLVTGGLAFRWHAARNGIVVESGAINDIDIVVAGLSDLKQSLAKDFLIVHFHPARGQGRVLIQLADELHRLRIDVFTPSSPTVMMRTRAAEVLGIHCRVVAAEDLAAKLLAVLYGVTDGKHVDPKHYDKFKLLSGFVDVGTMREIWADYRKPDSPHSFEIAAENVHQRIAKDPTVLQPDVYDQAVDGVCVRCENNSSFPISARAKIFEVLGYL